MSEAILINITAHECRVAVLTAGLVQEIYIEGRHHKGVVGNIYKGKILRILPGMQAAFVDIGLEKAAFLHVSDTGSGDVQQPIATLLHDGQTVLVQVIKEPLGNKGARVTMQLALPSRHLVFMPGDHVFTRISRRIALNSERDRLQTLLSNDLLGNLRGGYVIRTAAEGVADFESDIAYLRTLWEGICAEAKTANHGTCLHADLPLPLRALRDLITPKTDRICIDNAVEYPSIVNFIRTFMPEFENTLELYTHMRPLFDTYGVEEEIERALARKVPLKSGGYIVFDQTEAMTTIDINTGGFVGYRNVDETIVRTNLEAIHTLARQIRLRNIGGIIIIDFIDMADTNHRRQVLRMLEKCLGQDHTKTTISDMSPLGLVQVTRKRTRESLQHQLCEICHVCEGRGVIKSAETICHEIFREIMRLGIAHNTKGILILAAQSVVDRLLNELADSLLHLEYIVKKTITCQVESLYHQGQYNVVLL